MGNKRNRVLRLEGLAGVRPVGLDDCEIDDPATLEADRQQWVATGRSALPADRRTGAEPAALRLWLQGVTGTRVTQ